MINPTELSVRGLPQLDAALIYKLVRAEDWQQALQSGYFAGSADDRRDAYIHLSSADQVAGTLQKYFSQTDELLLLAVDPALLGTALSYEPSRGGALFPHLYGPLPVLSARAFAYRAHAQGDWSLTHA